MSFPNFNQRKLTLKEEKQLFQKVSKYYGTTQLMNVPMYLIEQPSTLWDPRWIIPYTEHMMEEVLKICQPLYTKETLMWQGEKFSHIPLYVLPNLSMEMNSIEDLPTSLDWKDLQSLI